MGERTPDESEDRGREPDFSWEDVQDLTSLSLDELKLLLSDLDAQEKEVSYRRRVLQGRIDVIRAEIVRRGGASLSPEELARVLMGSDPSDPDPATERGPEERQ